MYCIHIEIYDSHVLITIENVNLLFIFMFRYINYIYILYPDMSLLGIEYHLLEFY